MVYGLTLDSNVLSSFAHSVSTELTKPRKFGLFLLVFTAVLREGIETVIFLGAASFVSTSNAATGVGALAGIIAAIFLGYIIFAGSMKISIKKFFDITSILLILFAAGLVAQGVHELQEATIIPTAIEHVWDINPPVNPDGSYPILHEKGYIGSILKGLFGYNGNPSLIEVLGYFVYLVLVFVLWRNIGRVHKVI